PQSGEALERPQLEKLVEKERRRRVARDAARVEEGERGIERRAGARWIAVLVAIGDRREWCRLAHGVEEAFGRGRNLFDVDVLRRGSADQIAQAEQQRRPSGSATA